jgi:hypothetical protein
MGEYIEIEVEADLSLFTDPQKDELVRAVLEPLLN